MNRELMSEDEIDVLVKEAAEHIEFVKYSNAHQYSSLLISKLIQAIEDQGAIICGFENGTP